MTFTPFPKIARLCRDVVVTEKIDGTNAQVHIVQSLAPEEGAVAHMSLGTAGDLSMFAGSRSRWLTAKDDNFGFAKWVVANAEALFKLGPGSHFGEWWGQGIQRGYGLTEKRFSLFNTHRWSDSTVRPACCSVVPVLYTGDFYGFMGHMEDVMGNLEKCGSRAAPGFMKPEGIVVFHTASSTLYKKTLEKDEQPKGQPIAA